MPKPHSDDLRRKVIEAIELNGMKRCEASECFGISRNTINLWFRLREETGDIKPRQRKVVNYKTKITDWEKFQAFVLANADKTQAEMAQLWEGAISERTMGRGLKRIGFTRKKKLMATEKEMSKSAMRSEKSSKA
jgi:transposase